MKEGMKMDAFRRAVNALRLTLGRWQGIRQPMTVQPTEAQAVSTDLNTVLDVLGDAIATAEAMKKANAGEVGKMADARRSRL